MKPPNILVALDGTMKITDFGLARSFGTPEKALTGNVITRWYRPPEVIFGSTFYATGVDMWSMGCILAELFMREPLFPGKTDIDQLSKIFGIRGTPNDDIWPGATDLPYFFTFEDRKPIILKKIISNCSNEALDLIEQMLQLNPNFRITMDKALDHAFFKDMPDLST